MEIRLGSVWLLLSCSLQQSLLGILAFVPQTNAKNCIGSNGEPVKKVQMIRRIPGRCSGWEKTWSWASKTDCSTKYVYEYREIPSVMTGEVGDDCVDDKSTAASKDHFSVTEEKFLAIAFGSATVALLVLIVIIIISLLRRGHSRCYSLCGGDSGYSSANIIIAGSERENGQQDHACNEYVDEGHRMSENVYEEIKDGGGTKAKLPIDDDTGRKCYPDLQDCPVKELAAMPINGVSNGVVIPSAPYEEDLEQTTHVKSVPNEYGSMTDSGVCNSNDSGTQETPCISEQKSDMKGDVKDEKDKKDAEKSDGSRTIENAYSKFNDMFAQKQAENELVQPKAPLLDINSPVQVSTTSHSYENLTPNMQNDLDGSGYESLIKSQSDSGLSLTCANDVDVTKVAGVQDCVEPDPKVLDQDNEYSRKQGNVNHINPSHSGSVTNSSNSELKDFTHETQ